MSVVVNGLERIGRAGLEAVARREGTGLAPVSDLVPADDLALGDTSAPPGSPAWK